MTVYRRLGAFFIGVGSIGLTLASSALHAQVIPDGGTATVPANTSGNTVSFTVTNNADTQEWFTFSCTPGGQVTACTPPSNQYIDGWASVEVNVTFSTGAAGSGTVTLAASGETETNSDTGW